MSNNENRILIVEDSKSLRANLVKYILENAHSEVIIDTAGTLKEANELLTKNNYFVALLDLNLPDSNDGKIVNIVTKRQISSIILTGNEEFTKYSRNHFVIDYVQKNRPEDIYYVANKVHRLIKNKNYTALIVDDDKISNIFAKNYINIQKLNTVSVFGVDEAIDILESDTEISIVLLDYYMKDKNGDELLSYIRKRYSIDELPVIAMSSSSETEVLAQMFHLGANDFIHKPFTKIELDCRITNSINNLEHIKNINSLANTDFLTEVNNRRSFYKLSNKYYDSIKGSETTCALAMFDIDNFKSVNDTYGHDIGDEVLKAFANILKDTTRGADIVGRVGGEEFCILLKNVTKENGRKLFDSIRDTVSKEVVELPNGESLSVTASVGIATELNTSLEAMIKKSDELLYTAKHTGKNRVVADFDKE